MKTSTHSLLWLGFGLFFLLAFGLPVTKSEAADSITGSYKYEGKARAKDTAGGKSTKNFKGKMRVGRKTIRLQIPVSVNGRVVACRKMVRAKLNRRLQRNPARAGRRAEFANFRCKGSNWFGILRLRWVEHPEGYALAFTYSGINDETDAEKATGRFRGSTGTLSTESNTPQQPEQSESPTP